MTLKECYTEIGGDYEDVMRRFIDEARVDRFLRMFLDDPSFAYLCDSMQADRYEDAFHAVHTMKGISMNLSLSVLVERCVALTENLRSGQPDGATQPLFEQVQAEYARTTAAIRGHLL